MPGDCVAVSRPGKQGAKNEEVERALQQLDTGKTESRSIVQAFYAFLCRVPTFNGCATIGAAIQFVSDFK